MNRFDGDPLRPGPELVAFRWALLSIGKLLVSLAVLLLIVLLSACGGSEEAEQPGAGGGGGGRGGRGGPPGFGGGEGQGTAIPVDVMPVSRRDIADFLETNGTLEAENEVDIVARTTGPIVSLDAEEGQFVKRGQILARIDPDEIQADLEVARVNLEEARAQFERAKVSWDNQIISREAYDTSKASFDTAQAQIQSIELELSYTEIRAPFDGLIVERAIKFAEFVSMNQKLFRISDFTPLLCPIQIPEKDLARVRLNQPSYLTVEAFPGEQFEAQVLRVSPVVDAASGTFKVTLAVDGKGKLRPGMFASVFVEADRRENTLVIPRRALVLESIGDTVYVLADGVAQRREVELGYTESDDVEVLAGLTEGERVIVVGQDAVSDGTPVYVLAEGVPKKEGAQQAGGAGGFPGFGDGPPSPEQLDQMRKRMKERGMPDAQIDAMIERIKSGQGPPGGSRRPSGEAARSGAPAETGDGGGASEAEPASARSPREANADGRGFPFDPENITEEQLEMMRGRMKERGLSDEQIEQRIESIKKGEMPPRGPRGAGEPSKGGSSTKRPSAGPPGGSPPIAPPSDPSASGQAPPGS